MLVLKRKYGESIIISTADGTEFEIKVSDISEGRVKLAIDAPKTVHIMRKEVVEEAKEENKSALETIDFDKEKLKSLLSKNND